MANKTRIIVAMKNHREAFKFMLDVEGSLKSHGIEIDNTNTKYLVLRTPNTETGFIYDEREQPLDGVRADALFGLEPFKSLYRNRLALDAKYDVGMGLVDYIRNVEAKAKIEDAYKKYDEAIANHIYESMLYKTEPIKVSTTEWPKINPYITYGSLFPTNTAYGKVTVKPSPTLPEIKNVIFNNPATIVYWVDGTKTVVQAQGNDIYDPEKGLAMAMCKKMLGNKRDYYHTFKHWMKKCKEE